MSNKVKIDQVAGQRLVDALNEAITRHQLCNLTFTAEEMQALSKTCGGKGDEIAKRLRDFVRRNK